VYETVFVRTDRDLVVCATAASRSCSGTTATTSLAFANAGGECESHADARSITYSTRSDVDTDIQRTPNALDWSSVYFRTY
jgi:hypothetical protein